MGLPQPISDYTTQGSEGTASVHARVRWDLSSLGPTSCTVPDTNGKSNLDIKQKWLNFFVLSIYRYYKYTGSD